MSGAASIAAAKNRRTKPDPNQKPIISCSSKSGSSCPLPNATKMSSPPSLFDEESLQIKGPMHIMQVLHVHEQRLNKIDDKLNKKLTESHQVFAPPQVFAPQQLCVQEGQACDAECYDRISTLEEKVQMLEEVIMNLQLTLANVQSFAMETSLAMMKLQNQLTVTPSVTTPMVTTPTVTTPTVTVSDVTVQIEESETN